MGKLVIMNFMIGEDLKLSEEEFVKIVNDNMNKLNINKN